MSEEETAPAAEIAEVEEPTPETSDEETTETVDETDAESEDADSEEEKPDPRDKKLAELSYKEREAKRKIARLEHMLEMQIESVPKAQKSEAPKLEDFETIDEYVDAKLKHALSETDSSKEEVADTGMTEQEADMAIARDELYATGIGKYDDFADVVGAEHVTITADMASAIFGIDDADVQADIAYSLGNNPKEALRIAKLPPVRQIAEIAKLEVKMTSKASPKKQPSKAPKPIKPVGGKKTTNDEIGDVEEFESFMKKRNKQLGRG